MEKTLALIDKDIYAAGLEMRRVKTSAASLRSFGSINNTPSDDGISAALLRELRAGLENLLAHINHLLQLAQEFPSNQREFPGKQENGS